MAITILNTNITMYGHGLYLKTKCRLGTKISRSPLYESSLNLVSIYIMLHSHFYTLSLSTSSVLNIFYTACRIGSEMLSFSYIFILP